ncbi:hypothetical protein PC39_04802 [Salinisphaera sp. PC39]|uniref:hypothetical protein n=1 Tax=Salinisphaera sp. PC39 TaxID=1304156 RepID=UPI0033403994
MREQRHHGNPGHGLLIVAAAGALALAGCNDGSSGDGDSGDGLPSASQQAQIAALIGTDAISEFEEPPVGETPPQQGQSSMQARTAATDTTDQCESLGGEGTYTVDDDRAFNLREQGFPDDFSNVPADPVTGTRIVADCESDDFSFRGQFDIADAAMDGGEIVYYRAGGDGDGGAPDVDAFYDVASAQAGDVRTRGVLYFCDGCVAGDLGDFSGTAGVDATLAAFLVMEVLEFRLEAGNGLDDLLVFQQEDRGSGAVEQTIDGRMAFRLNVEDGDRCAFDVDYRTDTPLRIEDFDTADARVSTGALTIAVTGTDEAFDIEYNNGTVFVDGEEVTPEDVSDLCPEEA